MAGHNEDCLSEAQAAVSLGVSRITLLRARRRGYIRHYRIGRRVTYAPSHLREFRQSVERGVSAAAR
jgi:excisionase family DNA binding protein